MKNVFLSLSFTFFMMASVGLFAQQDTNQVDDEVVPEGYQVRTYIDNNGYWKRMARYGLAELNQDIVPEPAVFKGSLIQSRFLLTIEDSPDIPVATENTTQSENSIFINPEDNHNVLNSNNSTSSGGGLYGADGLFSFDAGDTWDGSIQGTGGSNSGDPSVVIGTNGYYYNGFINTGGGQSCAYSTNQGETWTSVLIASKPSGFSSLLDKNHLTIDNSPSSTYEGHLYSAWTAFGGSSDNEIEIARSTTNGQSWSEKIMISSGVNAGSHNQGVNVQTGPNGEVYVVWAIYDNWPGDENALGFAKSLDGGATFQPAYRIIENIKGIRNSTAGKNHRVNSFPSMAVDISNGDHSGDIYVVWANVGVPGTNTGPDVNVYMIKSTNGGTSWSSPVKINQDPAGTGKKHYFPWITCDPETGTLCVIFYDDRDVSANQVETWVAYSMDGGEVWDDFRVSDVAFTPAPIPGLASGYMGDYLGISAREGMVYPCWTDNRSGTALTYVSPFTTPTEPNPATNPFPVNNTANVKPFTSLHWSDPNSRATYFRLYLGTDNPPTNIINGVFVQDTFYTPGDDLDFQEQYFWKVKSYNSYGDAESETWSFSVEPQPDEDFETGNFQKNDWFFGGDANWAIDDDNQVNGTYSARSGNISHNESTSLKIELEVKFSPFASSITFWKKVSSQTGGDKLQFLIDDQIKGEWSGQSVWSEESFIISTGGFHTFEWKYIKDAAQSSGEDRAWIDYITFPLLEILTANAGPNATICQGSPYLLSGVANNQISILWTTSGDGSFDDPTLLEATYFPGMGDIASGMVVLTLTAYDEEDEVSDQMELTIQASPLISMEESYQICDTGVFSTENISADHYASLAWSTSGDGFFEDNTLLVTEYTPGPEDITNGSVQLTLTLTGLYPCEGTVDSLQLVINYPPEPASQPAGPTDLCQGETSSEYTIGTITGASQYHWMLSPPEAGTMIEIDTVLMVEWAAAFWGTVEISVFGSNECGDGFASDPLSVNLNPLPLQAAAPSGETYVCVNLIPSSDYTTTTTEFVTSYEWSVTPEEAGIITGNDTTGTVVWNQWEGTALIVVRGLNDCGEGIWSEAIEVFTDICTGLNEHNAIGQVTLLPNPNSGSFILKVIAAEEKALNVKILSPLNTVVFEQKDIPCSGVLDLKINLPDISPGTYLLFIEDAQSSVIEKLIIR